LFVSRSLSKPKMKLTPIATSPRATLRACAVPLRVYWVDVAMQLLQIVEGRILAHQLHQAGEDRVPGAAGGRDARSRSRPCSGGRAGPSSIGAPAAFFFFSTSSFQPKPMALV
jgi:hypothetical protein